MTPEQYQAVKSAFVEALELPAPARAARLAEESTIVREKVEQMLAEHDADANPLDAALEYGAAATPEARAVDAAGETDASAAPQLPDRIGPYVVEGVLGRGGMGTVYAARQLRPDRRVAVKLIRGGADGPEALARFRRESQVLGQLRHPGIAHVYEAGVARLDGREHPYFAMELVEGERLDRHVEIEGLDRDAILELVARVADAVQHAHQKGIIHRDLKPANILVARPDEPVTRGDGRTSTRTGTRTGTRHDAGNAPGTTIRSTIGADPIGRPVILDFGVSRVLDADGMPTGTIATRVGAVVGTLGYMAPEQIAVDDAPADTRCDIYALGVILFELCAGSLPFDLHGRSIAAASRILESEDAPRLGGRAPAFRGDVETIVAKALEKDRNRRYASAAEFADDLRRCRRDEPILARPASALYQLRKFARRNRAVVAAAGTSFVAVLAGLVVALVLLGQVAHERDAAEEAEQRQESIASFQARILSELDVGPMSDAVRDELLLQIESRAPDDAALRSQVELLDTSAAAIAAFEEALAGRAGRLLDEGYTDDPIVEASLRDTVARMYDALQKRPSGAPHWIRGWELLRDRYGLADRRTLERLPNALRGWRLLGDKDEARRRYDETMAAIDGRLDPLDPIVLRLRLVRTNLTEPGDPERLERLRALRADTERAADFPESDRIGVLVNLALAEMQMGDADAGFALWEQRFMPLLRADDPTPTLRQAALVAAYEYGARERWNEAAAVYGEVARLGMKLLGREGGYGFDAACSRATALVLAGRDADADAAFRELEASLQADADPNGDAVVRRWLRVVSALMEGHRWDWAERVAEDVIERRRAGGYAEDDRHIEAARSWLREIERLRSERG